MCQLKQWDIAASILRRVLKGAERPLPSEVDAAFALAGEWGVASLADLATERSALAKEAAETLALVYEADSKLEAADEVRKRIADIERQKHIDWMRCITADLMEEWKY